MNQAAQLLAFVAVFCGWQLFDDGPLAYYVACGLLVAQLCLHLALQRSGRWSLVYGYGALMGLNPMTPDQGASAVFL